MITAHTGIPNDADIPRDNIVEMMTPITTWGQTFAVAPTPGIVLDEAYIIVTAEDNTRVRIDGDAIDEDVS